MLYEQKSLLADVRSAQAAAVALHQRGVKVSTILQKLRSAGDELETRVRFLEKQAGARVSPRPVAAPKSAAVFRQKRMPKSPRP